MIILGIAMLVTALDQATKFLILRSLHLNESVTLCPNLLYFTYIQNPGTAFGFMSNMELFVRIPFFVAVTALSVFIVHTYQRFLAPDRLLSRVALGLVLGGAFGNFIDRLLHGKVIDFMDVRYHEFQWYIFNVADSCITVGLIFLLLEFIFRKSGKNAL